jgi:16S rRNA (guanine(966)-N(2))-methyltransferase RsmD
MILRREQVRVIAGKWRSRKLAWPSYSGTRPMPDRVKEAIFSMLGTWYDCPGELPPIRVADVFAGSGAMGIEALSRGAADCCFFERNAEPRAVLKKNLAAFDIGEEGRLCSGNAWTQALRHPDGGPFDLFLFDPPYRASDDTSDRGPVRRFLAQLATQDDGAPTIVLHHRKNARYEADLVEPWQIWRQRTFGTNTVSIFTK